MDDYNCNNIERLTSEIEFGSAAFRNYNFLAEFITVLFVMPFDI